MASAGEPADERGVTGRARLGCPAGHDGDGLYRRGNRWFCRRCDRAGIDPTYSYARDWPSGRFLTPAEASAVGGETTED